MPVLSLACHLSHNTPNIPSRYNNEQTTKQTKAINNSYIYIYISCKCDTNRAGHFTFDAYASRPVACIPQWDTVGCNYLSLPLIPASDTCVFRYRRRGHARSISITAITVCRDYAVSPPGGAWQHRMNAESDILREKLGTTGAKQWAHDLAFDRSKTTLLFKYHTNLQVMTFVLAYPIRYTQDLDVLCFISMCL